MGMKGLGRVFDIQPVFAPVDLNTAGGAGLRVSLENAGGVTFVFYNAVGTAGEDPVITVREADAASGGTEQDLDVVTEWYSKTDTTNNTLSGNETWTKHTQGTAGDIDLDAEGGNAEDQAIVAFYIDADDLSDGFTHVTFDVADVGAAAQLGAGLAILHDLKVARAPENLPAAQ